jgi:hypothetical protein
VGKQHTHTHSALRSQERNAAHLQSVWEHFEQARRLDQLKRPQPFVHLTASQLSANSNDFATARLPDVHSSLRTFKASASALAPSAPIRLKPTCSVRSARLTCTHASPHASPQARHLIRMTWKHTGHCITAYLQRLSQCFCAVCADLIRLEPQLLKHPIVL